MKNHFLPLQPCVVPHLSHPIICRILPAITSLGFPLYLLLHDSHHWLVLAGEDQHRCSHSGADGPWVPEPPGPGRGCCQPGGKTEHLSHHLHRQLPRRLKNCPSGGEPLDMKTLPPAPPGYIYTSTAPSLTELSRNTVAVSHLLSSPATLNPIHAHLYMNCLLFHLILYLLMPVLRSLAYVFSACAVVWFVCKRELTGFIIPTTFSLLPASVQMITVLLCPLNHWRTYPIRYISPCICQIFLVQNWTEQMKIDVKEGYLTR